MQYYNAPSQVYMPIAEKILESFLREFKSESEYLASEGEIVSQEETEQIFQQYIEELEFTDQLSINF